MTNKEYREAKEYIHKMILEVFGLSEEQLKIISSCPMRPQLQARENRFVKRIRTFRDKFRAARGD